MPVFELWLDESGDFSNDADEIIPSLVGGILVEKNSFDDSSLNYVVPENKKYHSCENTDTYIRFSRVEEKLFVNDTNRMVVFSNEERILILDKTMTYLNIISEGIIQLIEYLKSKYDDVFVRILYSGYLVTDVRTVLFPNGSTISKKEYELRLKEKIAIAGYRSNIRDNEWELKNAPGSDKRMMMADIVCNTIYTRYKPKKFTEEERKHIGELYQDDNKTLVFAIGSAVEKSFKNHLIENQIGEAVVDVCLLKKKTLLNRCFRVLKKRIEITGIHDVRFQYNFIAAYIEYYINVVKDYDQCMVLLRNLLNYYIPMLREYEERRGMRGYSDTMELDIKFYLLTICTHKGNVAGIRGIEEECDKLLSRLPSSLETVNYKIKYENRKTVGLIDSFEFDKALITSNELVRKCREIKKLLDCISDDDAYYEELGKVLGTRLQIKTLLLRFDKNLYTSAVADSQEAIDSFITERDKQRQYLYRSQLEIAACNFDEALYYLKLAAGCDPNCSMNDLFSEASKSSYQASVYVSLMSEGKISGWKQASELYRVGGLKEYIDELSRKNRHFHPDEITLWKYASYLAMRENEVEVTSEYYQLAMAACFERDTEFSINVIGLAVGFDYLAYLTANNAKNASVKAQIKERWAAVSKNDTGGVLSAVFGDVNFKKQDTNYYYNLSRKITY